MFITVFTRACDRPRLLKRCIESVKGQEFKDWEQIIVLDRKRRGLIWANERFHVHRDLPRGEYVCHVDDDGFIPDPEFLLRVYDRARFNAFPDVILVRSVHYDDLLPPDHVWELDWENGERPGYWIGSGYCFVVKRELWAAQTWRYHRGQGTDWMSGGDWQFMTGLCNLNVRIVRLNMEGATGVRARAKAFERPTNNWFGHIVKRYGMEVIGDDVWRLQGEGQAQE